MRKLIAATLFVILVAFTTFVITLFYMGNQKLPTGESGPAAEELTDTILQAVAVGEWKSLAAVEFSFVPSATKHFHDFTRGLVEVTYDGGNNKIRVQYDEKSGRHLAWKGQTPLSGSESDEAYETARTLHKTDLFWFYPFASLRDPGVERKMVAGRALLVTYPPGSTGAGEKESSSYLIVVDTKGRPTHWKMWVDYVRLKGVEVSFDNWKKLATGVPVSLHRKNILRDLDLELLGSYKTYPEEGQRDRFAPLLKAENG